MKETFHTTRSMRIGSIILMALLRAGVPLDSLVLFSVRGRKSGKISTIPVALVEQDSTIFLVVAFGEVSWVRNLNERSLIYQAAMVRSSGLVERASGISRCASHGNDQSRLIFEAELFRAAVCRSTR